jgi:hypothetical protein
MPPSSPATPGPVIPPRKGAAIRRPPRRQDLPPQAARRRPASPRSGATPGRQRAATTAAPSPRPRSCATRRSSARARARAVSIARGSRPPSPCAASTASPPLPCPEASGSPDPSRGKGAIQATSRPCNNAPILSYPIGRIGGRGGRAREADRRNESHSLRLGTCLTVRPVPRHRQSSDRAGRFLHGRSCWCRLASPPAVVWHRLRPVGALPRYRFGLGPRGLSAVGRWRGRPGSRTEADFSRRINRPNPSRRIWRMVAAIGMRASCCPSLARWTRPPAGR